MDSHTSPGLPVRGRRPELEVADRHLAAISRGGSGVLVVHGSDGSGVSRLLQAVCERASEAGLMVCAATATPGDQLLPFGQLVAALDDEALGLRPAGRRTGSSGDQARYQLLRTIEHHLRELSQTRRVIVCLDDIQLADASTLAGLRHLAAELADRPIGWLLGARGTDWPPELEVTWAALQARGAHCLHLRPLEAAAVGQIVQDHLGRPPGPELRQLVDGAARHPGLLVALLQGLREEGLVHVSDRRADLLRADIPERVRDIARDRLEPLSPQVRDVARAAAVLGRTCTFARLAAMLELGAGALLRPLDELARRGILVGAEDRLVFVEELIGEAIVAMLPTPVRMAVQRQAADVLAAEASQTLGIATHLVSEIGDARADAGTALLDATRRLGATHPHVAAEIGGRALRSIGGEDPAYGTLAAETVVVLHAAGEHEQGQALAASAFRDPASADAEGELRLQLALAFALPSHARAETAKRALSRPGLSPALEARLRASLVVSLAACGEIEEAQLVARAVLDDDRRAGEPRGPDAARRSHALAVAAHVQGSYDTTFARLDEAEARAAAHPDAEFEAMRELTRSEVGSMAHGPDWALAISTARCAWARRERYAVASRLWQGIRGRQLVQAGRLDEAVEVLRPLFPASDDGDLRTCWEAAALVAFAQAALHVGSTGDVYAARARAHRALESPSPEIRRQALWLLACTGESPLDADPVWSRLPQGTVLEAPRCPADLGDPARFVRMYRAADAAAAERAVTVAQIRRDHNPGSVLLAAAERHAAGLLAGDAAALERAAMLLDAGGRPLDAAAALEDRASVLASQGAAPAERRHALEEACRSWENVGAVADVARIRDKLHAAGA